MRTATRIAADRLDYDRSDQHGREGLGESQSSSKTSGKVAN